MASQIARTVPDGHSIIKEAVFTIPLSSGKFAIVSAEDFEWAKSFKWRALKTRTERRFYAVRSHGTAYLHREIMKRSGIDVSGFKVDHRNRDTLDDRRSNLRIGTNSQNRANAYHARSRNKIPYKGVHPTKGSSLNPWHAKIMHNYKSIYLGTFPTAELAAKAYDAAAIRLFGEFAATNFK